MTEKWEAEIEGILARAELPEKSWQEMPQEVFGLMVRPLEGGNDAGTSGSNYQG